VTNSEAAIKLRCEAPKGLTTNLAISLGAGPTGIIGESGAGKSTFARFLAGFESVAKQVRQIPDHIERIGMVFQHGALFEHLTVRGNLNFFLQPQQD
jgi:ABC-type Fe3+/spermidine/putrescine transport system ATPase subunit